MESIDITRLLDDSFISDDDLVDSGIKHGLYQRACYETEALFRKNNWIPIPCDVAQVMIIRYNKLLKEYEDGKSKTRSAST